MYKYILESAGNINWMAVSALLTFVTIFTLSAIMAFKADRKHINHMANLPLDDNQLNSNSETDSTYEK